MVALGLFVAGIAGCLIGVLLVIVGWSLAHRVFEVNARCGFPRPPIDLNGRKYYLVADAEYQTCFAWERFGIKHPPAAQPTTAPDPSTPTTVIPFPPPKS